MSQRFQIAKPVAVAVGALSLLLAYPISHSHANDAIINPDAVYVEMSSNGWGSGNNGDTTLFNDAILVPGRSESATMLVRNIGPGDGHLVATLADTDLIAEVNEHGVRVFDYITVNVRVSPSDDEAAPRLADWNMTATAAELADGHVALYSGHLSDGELVELAFDINFHLPPGSDPVICNQALVGLREMTFNVHLNLSDPAGPGGGGDGGNSGGGDGGNGGGTVGGGDNATGGGNQGGGNQGGGNQGSGAGDAAAAGTRPQHPATGISNWLALVAAALLAAGTGVGINESRKRKSADTLA